MAASNKEGKNEDYQDGKKKSIRSYSWVDKIHVSSAENRFALSKVHHELKGEIPKIVVPIELLSKLKVSIVVNDLTTTEGKNSELETEIGWRKEDDAVGTTVHPPPDPSSNSKMLPFPSHCGPTSQQNVTLHAAHQASHGCGPTTQQNLSPRAAHPATHGATTVRVSAKCQTLQSAAHENTADFVSLWDRFCSSLLLFSREQLAFLPWKHDPRELLCSSLLLSPHDNLAFSFTWALWHLFHVIVTALLCSRSKAWGPLSSCLKSPREACQISYPRSNLHVKHATQLYTRSPPAVSREDEARHGGPLSSCLKCIKFREACLCQPLQFAAHAAIHVKPSSCFT